MKKKNTTSKYKRTYGKNLKTLAKELGLSMPTVILRHRNGDLKHLEIEDPKEAFKPLEKRILKLINNINSRCNNDKDVKYKFYGGKGIKNFLNLEDIIYLWKRDSAEKMKQPSIDRIDSNGHYRIENCRFIEMSENRTRRI